MENVPAYVKEHSLQYRDAAEIFEEFSNDLAKMKGKCIDIGCGPGDVTVELILPKLPADAQVVGADISKDMLDYATKVYAHNKRLSFIQLDIDTSALPSEQIGQYDNAVSSYCLHWCQSIRRGIGNVYNLLRPGGEALLIFLGYHDIYGDYLTMQKNARYEPYLQTVQRYQPYFQSCKDPQVEIRGILTETGFEILHCSHRDRTFVHENKEAYKTHVISVNPFISQIPVALREGFIDALMKEASSHRTFIPIKDVSGQLDSRIVNTHKCAVMHVKKPLTAQ